MSRLREKLVKTQSQQTQKTLTEDDQFLTGRFRWEWILDAHRCRAGLVGMYLLRLGYMWKTDRLQVSTKRSAEVLGVDRKTVYRQLNALERASLVAVDRHRGRWPVVHLLEDPVLRRVDTVKAVENIRVVLERTGRKKRV